MCRPLMVFEPTIPVLELQKAIHVKGKKHGKICTMPDNGSSFAKRSTSASRDTLQQKCFKKPQRVACKTFTAGTKCVIGLSRVISCVASSAVSRYLINCRADRGGGDSPLNPKFRCYVIKRALRNICILFFEFHSLTFAGFCVTLRQYCQAVIPQRY